MKKVTLTGKLSLNKETLSTLNDFQMTTVKGGDDPTAEKRLSWFRCCKGCSKPSLGSYCDNADDTSTDIG